MFKIVRTSGRIFQCIR